MISDEGTCTYYNHVIEKCLASVKALAYKKCGFSVCFGFGVVFFSHSTKVGLYEAWCCMGTSKIGFKIIYIVCVSVT